MNTIVVLVCIVVITATLASFLYFVVRDHIHTLKDLSAHLKFTIRFGNIP